jgi:pimeloyl-ACP methyl ester carboxylesterase
VRRVSATTNTPACVIAVHGAVANAATWIPLRRLMHADDVDLIADDLPGHGTRRSEPFDFDRAAAELIDRAFAESRRRPTIVAGDSLGGYLALTVAAQCGSALQGVIAGSCTFAMRGIAGVLARTSLVPDALVPPAALAAVLARSCAPDVAAAILARGLAPSMRNMTLRALLGRDVRADVVRIAAPIVFVTGSLDVPIVWSTRSFARMARHGSVQIVARRTHGVGLSSPQTFAAAARALLSASDPGCA